MDTSKIILIAIAVAVVLILSSRNLGSFWSLIYKLVVGAITTAICLFVLQKVDVDENAKWIFSFIVGMFVAFAANAIPWR